MTRIVALGGTVKPGSSTEQALRLAASIAGGEGAEVTVFSMVSVPMACSV